MRDSETARAKDAATSRAQEQHPATPRIEEPSVGTTPEYFHALVQTLPDATIVLDGELRVRHQTPSATQLLGRDADDRERPEVLALIHPQDRDGAAAFLSHALSHSGPSEPTEWRVQHAEGHWLHLEIACGNMLDDPRLQCLVLSARDIGARKALEQQLSHQAFHDPLTDLANRALLLDRVEHAFQRERRPFSLLFLDLDNFKAVNDSLGHAVGDKLLKSVAARLRTCLRPTDTAARLGGDEFALLLEDARTSTSAADVAERVLRALGKPFVIDGRESFTQASIGIATSTLANTKDELLRNADIAMYQAKQRGKGTFVAFEPKMHAEALDRCELESDLRVALLNDQFVLHYQPIVELSSGRIAGLEALLRWNHPDRGLLAPSRFVEIAEDTGLISPIGEWVIHRACDQLGSWQQQFPNNGQLTMAVNLSGRQLESAKLLDQVLDASRGAGVNPAALLLEITETVMVRNAERSAGLLSELRQRGSRIAIDDFGMGYSSLHYLHSFPIDLLKVAKPFVDGVAQDEQKAAFTKTIMDLCQTLGLGALAEGVESDAQVDALRSLRCGLAQGFYLSRPLDVDATTALLTQGGSLGRYAHEVLGAGGRREQAWWKQVTGREGEAGDGDRIGRLPATLPQENVA